MAASSNRFVPFRWVIAGCTASVVAAAGGVTGCASKTTGASAQAGDSSSSTRITRLRDAAARESSRDPSKTESLALPPGLTPEQIAPIPAEAMATATLSLDQAIDDVLAKAKTVEKTPIPEVAEVDQDAALRLYLQARNKLSSDDPAGAQDDLIASLKLDPRPAEVWRELGEAQRRMGNRSGALLAYQQAAFREPDDVRTLEQIGRLAFERREYAMAAEHLGRLSRQPMEQIDPVLPFTVNAQLGRSLIALGYVNAGAEAIRASLQAPDRISQVTTRAEDFSSLFRQRGELWRDIGDASLRLGRFEDASTAYAQSADLPTLNPGSIVSRRIYALLREGRSAGAAAVLIEEIIGVRGRCEARVLDLVGYVAASDPVAGRQLGEAIAGVPELLTENERALAASSLARARAAAVGPDEGAKVLREYLARAPGEEAVLSDLLTLWRSRPAVEALREVVSLVESAPLFEPKYVAALVRSTGTPATWLAEIDPLITSGPRAAAARLVKARLLMLSARVNEATAVLAEVLEADPTNTAAIVAQVRALTALGRTAEADALLEQLPDIPGPAGKSARFAKAVALAERDNPEAALALVAPMLDDEIPAAAQTGAPPRADVASLAARLALRLERYDDAEKWFQLAIRADPMRDDAYASLMRLYSPNQPLANEQKLMETAQTLRAAAPSSPTLRWLHARENAARGQFDVAERELVELDDQYPDQSEILDLLLSIWTRTGSLDRATEFLTQRTTAIPASREYPLRLADALAARGKFEDARRELEKLIERSPGDLQAMRKLEALLRDKLANPAAADELAIRRLDRSPRTFETALERTLVQLRGSDPDSAVASADATMTLLREPPTTNELARIAAAAALITQEAERSARRNPVAVQVQSRLMTAPGLSTQAHTAHILLMARQGGSLERLLEACDRAVEANPSMREAAYLLAIREVTRPDPRSFGLGDMPPQEAGLRIAQHAATRPGQLTATLAAVWLDAATIAGDTDSLELAIRTSKDAGLFESALDALSNTGRTPGGQRETARAEPLAVFAETFLGAGKQELADDLYRMALKFDPEHPTSNNALGYQLLERGESLEEAERMIEIAFRQEPYNAAIIDSMGWARYKRGFIHNEVDADGRTRRGAISLLTEAVREAAKSKALIAEPILRDHLADAVWASGDRQRAVDLWEEAAQQAETVIRVAEQEIGPERAREMLGLNGSPLAELRNMVASVREKTLAAREDRAPPISRIFGPINQPMKNDVEQMDLPPATPLVEDVPPEPQAEPEAPPVTPEPNQP